MQWENVSADRTAGDLAIGEFAAEITSALLCLSIVWVLLTYESQSSVVAGCIHRVHLAVVPNLKFDFSLLFFS